MDKKFEHMLNNYINGNLFDFKKELKGLSKINLILFLQYCDDKSDDCLTIWSIKNYL